MTAAPLVATAVASDPRLVRIRDAVRRGQVRAALAAIDRLRGESAVLPFHSSVDDATLGALEIESRLAIGDLTGATTVAERLAEHLDSAPVGPDLSPDLSPGLGVAIARTASGEVAAASGEVELAVDHFLAAGAALGASTAECVDPAWRSGAALALLRAGRRGEALATATENHRLCEAFGTAHDRALALRTWATTDIDPHRATRLHQALAVLADDEAGVEGHARLHAQISTDLAGLMVLTGEISGALALLRGAETLAGRQGLEPLQGRVRRLLEHAGEAPQRSDEEALAVLTAAERRVALLAVAGLTNRAVAAELGVSVKAVEGHLSKVYRKLGLTSRAGLAATIGPRV